jgi:tight adherence protein B
MLSILIAMTVFLGLTGVYFAVTARQEARKRVAIDRVSRMLAGDTDPEVVASILRETQSDLGSLLSEAAQRYRWLRAIELMLYQAGRPMELTRLLGLTAGLAVAGGVIGWLLGLGPLPALLGAGPMLVVRHLKKRRMKAFEAGFPNALSLFSRALRAGHSMSSGLQMVGSELPDPVGPEFALVAREISLGLDAGVAMANLQDRLDCEDLPVFVTAVLVQLETGGNLAESLDNIGEVIRQRILFHGKVKALTAQAMMSANVLVLVPLFLFIMLKTLNPEFMAPMLESAVGRHLLMAAAAMVSIGWFACRRVARVEV